MRRVFAWFVIFLFVTLPIVTAVEISDVKFFDDDRELVSFRFDEDYNVRMEITLDEPAHMRLDKSEFHPSMTGFPFVFCDDGICIFDDLKLYIPPSGSFSAEFDMGDIDRNGLPSISHTFTFSQDVSHPRLTKIAPVGCDTEQCYFGPDTESLRATIGGSASGFSSLEIIFAGRSYDSYDCDTTGCLFDISDFHGQSGTSYDVYLEEGSTDIAGNEIQPKDEPDTIIYDGVLPQPDISSISIATEGQGVVYSPGPMAVEVLVNDHTPVELFVSFVSDEDEPISLGESAMCEEVEDVPLQQRCSVILDLTGARAYRADVNIKLVDSAGNVYERDLPYVQVLEGEETEVAPDLWEISHDEVMPNRLNLGVARLFDKTVYHYMELEPKHSGVVITSMDVEDCSVADGNGTDPLGTLPFIMNNHFGSTNPVVYYKFKQLLDYGDATSITYNCSLSIFSRRGTRFFMTPEIESYVFTLDLYETPMFADQVAEELATVREEQEKIQRQYGQIYEGFQMLMNICNTLFVLQGGGMTLNGAALGVSAVPILQPVALALNSAGNALSTVTGSILQGAQFRLICDFVTCNVMQQGEIRQKMVDILTFGLADFEFGTTTVNDVHGNPQETSSVTGQGAAANALIAMGGDPAVPGNNLIIDAASLCLPGLMIHMDKKISVDCQYLECLDRDVRAGFPVSECVALRGYSECKYILGEVWNILPITAFFSRMVRALQELLRDPVALVGIGVRLYCALVPNVSGSALCTISIAVQTISDLVQFFQSLSNINMNTGSYCGHVLDQDYDYNNILNSPYGTDNVECNDQGCTYVYFDRPQYTRGNDLLSRGGVLDNNDLSNTIGDAAADAAQAQHVAGSAARDIERLLRDAGLTGASITPGNRQSIHNQMIQMGVKPRRSASIIRTYEHNLRVADAVGGRYMGPDIGVVRGDQGLDSLLGRIGAEETAVALAEESATTICSQTPDSPACDGAMEDWISAQNIFDTTQSLLDSYSLSDDEVRAVSSYLDRASVVPSGRDIPGDVVEELIITKWNERFGDSGVGDIDAQAGAYAAAASAHQQCRNNGGTRSDCRQQRRDLKAAEKDLRGAQRSAIVDVYNENWVNDGNKVQGMTWPKIKDIFDAGRAWHTISSFAFSDQDFGGYSRAVDRIFSVIDVENQLYSKVCESDFDRPQSTNGPVMNVEGNLMRPAIHIEASYDETETPDGETWYSYFVTAQAQTQYEFDDVELEIKLGNEVVHEQNFTAMNMLDRGRSNPIVLLNVTDRYTSACIEFNKPLTSIFDFTSVSGSKFCAQIEET